MNTMESARDRAQQLEGLIAARRNAEAFDPPPGDIIDFGQYSGFYDPQPWDREAVVVPWAGGLAMNTASEPEPGKNLTRLKPLGRSEEHTSELQSLMRLSYDVFSSDKKNYC